MVAAVIAPAPARCRRGRESVDARKTIRGTRRRPRGRPGRPDGSALGARTVMNRPGAVPAAVPGRSSPAPPPRF